MVEKLNSTVISALKACTTTPTDWVDCLQSVAMSIRSQPHESTGISPYEMMFGTPMRLPTELEDGDIPTSASKEQMAQIFPQPPEGEQSAKIFESVDKIRQIIHNSASGNISRAKTKQAFYFEQRHRGIPLQIGDKVLHYNRRAGQCLGDKLHGRWIGPYLIVGMNGKNKYQVKDMNGYVLKTYLNGSNLKRYLTKEDVNVGDPDLVPAGELPEKPDTVDDLLASIKHEKERSKSRGLKRRKPADVDSSDSDLEDTSELTVKSNDKGPLTVKRKRKAADVDMLFPDPQQKTSKKPRKKVNSSCSPPAKPIGDKRNISAPLPPSQIRWNEQNVKMINPSGNIPSDKEKKTKFFNEMIRVAADENIVRDNSDGCSDHTQQSDSDDDVKITGVQELSNYVFNPLTIQQRRIICERISLQMRKENLNHSNVGEKILSRSPKVRSVKGDGNCFFRAIAVGTTGWEVGHLAIRRLVCDYIKSFGPYTRQCEGKVYLNQTKMKTDTTFATDVEIMAAAQVLGVDIYVYHMYGKSLRWLRFPCKHQSGTSSSNGIYLDNRYGNGKTGHFDFITGMF